LGTRLRPRIAQSRSEPAKGLPKRSYSAGGSRQETQPRNESPLATASFLPNRLRFGPPTRRMHVDLLRILVRVFETAIVRGEGGPFGYDHRALDAVVSLAHVAQPLAVLDCKDR